MRWLRVALRRLVMRFMLVAEWCRDCGRKTGIPWSTQDGIWKRITGGGHGVGPLCPQCFTERARRAGYLLLWTPAIDGRAICPDCGEDCDRDGYCDPCANAAVAEALRRDPHLYDHIGLQRGHEIEFLCRHGHDGAEEPEHPGDCNTCPDCHRERQRAAELLKR